MQLPYEVWGEIPTWKCSPLKDHMQRVNLLYFFRFGGIWGAISSMLFSDEKLDSWRYSSAVNNAKTWFESWQADPIFPKTAKAAINATHYIEEFAKLLGNPREATSTERLPVTDAIMAFVKAFEQEVEDARIFAVMPLGAYSVIALLESASTHLSSEAQEVMGKAERADYDAAGECLSLDLFTASGFHSMRAIEAEARMYHHIATGVEMDDVPLGAIINGDKNYKGSGLKPLHQKEGEHASSPLGLIVSLLASINKLYRCPIMHPEMTLNQKDAKQIFDLAAITISAMIEDGQRRIKDKKAALSLPSGSQTL